MKPQRKLALPLLAATALLAALIGLGACGYESHETEVEEGEPVKLGELKYNAIFSRFLNPADAEDSAYLVGQPPEPPGSGYFGVFFEVQNESDDPHRLVDEMTVHDAEGETYEVLESKSLFAFPFGAEVEGREQIPILDSTAQQGAIEGSVALFLIPDAALENRPLVLEVPSPDGSAEITLDL